MKHIDRNKRWVVGTNYCRQHGMPWCIECEKADNEDEKELNKKGIEKEGK